MRITIALFLFFQAVAIVAGQTKEIGNLPKIDFSFAPIVGAHFTTINKQFENLNTSLSQNGFPTISPAFNSVGVALVYKSAKSCGFTEFAVLQATHDIKKESNQYRLVPKIKGYTIRGILTKKLWEKKWMRLEGGFGMSTSKFHFKLVDRIPIQSPFDTLLKSPISASSALDYAQTGLNWNIEGRFGLTYNTNWFKKTLDAYEFSLFINYSQTVINSKNWAVDETRIKIPNFPTLNFSNCYIQFVNSVYFKRK